MLLRARPTFICLVVLLIAISSSAQGNGSRHQNRLTKSDSPDCTDGRGCQTFKQMWSGGDSVVKSATWACFKQTDMRDEFLLLTDGNTFFEMHSFANGVENISAKAQAEYFRDRTAHWKPENSSTSLDVTKSTETLWMDLRFASTEKQSVHLEFTMRLSSGRFKDKWTTEKKNHFSTETSNWDDAGQCVLLPKTTK